MGSTFLMSYPGPSWHIRGGENFRSRTRATASPKRALEEWIGLADAIVKAGGHILVMAPPSDINPPLTGMVYTANSGHLFRHGDEATFLVSKMSIAHRQAERDVISAFMTRAGLTVRDAAHAWEGQADLQLVGNNRYIATWGVRSVKESVGDVRSLLPPNARLLDVQLRDPFFHGDVCLDALVNRAGKTTLLVHSAALVGTQVEALQRFVGSDAEVLSVDAEDALGYACNSLCVNGTVLMPSGLSTALRGQLIKRGFTLEALEFPELFGKGGGGPRCLVNELRGFVLNPGAPDYATLRDSILERASSYPETYAPAAPTA